LKQFSWRDGPESQRAEAVFVRSTVAVAGSANEVVPEDAAIDWPGRTTTLRAHQKIRKHMLHQLLADVPHTIFRPAIVLGDSRRVETSQFDMVKADVLGADACSAAASSG
jgi:hypothetical protein